MELRTRHAAGGFTLLESLLAATVLAMVICAVTVPFTTGVLNEQVNARRTLAVNLAEEMMEEILAKPYEDPQGASQVGPEPGENRRSRFDNIDDYNGYTESAGEITDVSGEVVTDPAARNLSRHVTAGYVYVAGQDTDEDASFIRVVVQVRYKDQPIATLTRLVYDTN